MEKWSSHPGDTRIKRSLWEWASPGSGSPQSGKVGPQLGHPPRKRRAFGRRHVQAFLGPPPQHVVGLDRPFVAHQVAHLGLVETAAEMAAEIGHRPDVLQKLV